MSKHTPGPWKWYDISLFSHDAPDNANGLVEFGPGDWGSFWMVGHNGIDRNLEKITHTSPSADGRLIAAAPDLLAALKLARSHFWIPGGTHPGQDQAVADLDIVVAAIRAAEEE